MRIIIGLVITAALVIIVDLAFIYFQSNPSTPASSEKKPKIATGIISTEQHPEFDTDRPVRILDTATVADRLNSPDNTIHQDLEIVFSLVDSYHQIFKKMPTGGLNEEIIASISGKNAKRLGFISPKHPAISEKGELLDRFGTPFYFHPVSSAIMEIRSAGPDKKLFSEDDILRE